MSLLPSFTFDSVVTADDGREDKVTIQLRAWIVCGRNDELETLREYIALAPANVRENGDAETIGLYGWIFNRPSEVPGRRNKLEIRTRPYPFVPSHRAGKPLFSGHLFLRNAQSQQPGARTLIAHLDLSLNPLRYVRHQLRPRLPIGPPATWPPPRLVEKETSVETGGEFSLDGNDNWLPSIGLPHAYGKAAHWPHHLRRYLRTVADALTAELRRVTESHGGTVTLNEDFSLKEVETAFDFAANEPTELVRSLLPLLSSYRADNAGVSHFEVPPDVDRKGNSLCVRVRIRDGVKLRVYAKTNRRVRFEIIHDSINIRELLGETPIPHAQAARHTSRDYEQAIRCFAALRERAANEMNALLEHFRSESRIIPSHISPLSFLVTVASVLGDSDLAHTVVSLLTTHQGGISSREAPPELRAAAHKLTEAGVLAFNRARRGYQVTVPYREALSVMRGNDTLYLLTTARQRSRRRNA